MPAKTQTADASKKPETPKTKPRRPPPLPHTRKQRRSKTRRREFTSSSNQRRPKRLHALFREPHQRPSNADHTNSRIATPLHGRSHRRHPRRENLIDRRI